MSDDPSHVVGFAGQFPDEVLLHIVTHLLPDSPTFDILPASRADLHALCLTTRATYRLAQEVLYQDLLIPSAAHARRFLDSIRGPEHLALIRRTLRTIHFGCIKTSRGVDWNGEFAGEVLAVPSAPGLEAVTFRDLRVTPQMLWTLKNLRRLECDAVSFPAEVRLRLPSLEHLFLADVYVDHSEPGDFPALLDPIGLPALTSLKLHQHAFPDNRAADMADRHAALRALAPQLEELVLDEELVWIDPTDTELWTSMSRLRELNVVEPPAGGAGPPVLTAAALRHLPRSLECLTVATPQAGVAAAAHVIGKALEEGSVSVIKLQSLELGAQAAEGVGAELTAWVEELAQEKLAAVAAAKGVEVVQATQD